MIFLVYLVSQINRIEAQFSSVTQFCPTLWDPMDCSTPGFPVHHQLPEHAQIQTVMPSNYLILCRPLPLLPSIFPASGSFLMSQFFASGGQSIGASASSSVLPVNVQDWFPLGMTDLISLQSKGLSKVFSNTTVQMHRFYGAQLFFIVQLTSIHDYWKNHRIEAAAKSLQSCLTLCDPIDGSPPGSPSLGFSRQEHWSGLPFPSPMHESEKWKWNHSVVSESSQPQGLQPTRLLCPWDFPGKSTGVGCHCLLWELKLET